MSNGNASRFIALSILGLFILLILFLLASSILPNDILSDITLIPENISGINYVFHLVLSLFMIIITGITILMIILGFVVITIIILKDTFPMGLLYFPICMLFAFGITYILSYSVFSVLIFKGFYLFNISELKGSFFMFYFILFIPRIIIYIIKKNFNILHFALVFIVNILITFDIIYLTKYFNDSIIISILTIISIIFKCLIPEVPEVIHTDKFNININKKKISNDQRSDGKDHEDVENDIWVCSSCSNNNPIFLTNCEKCGKLFEK